MLLISSFPTASAISGNVILFEVKILSRNIEETTLAKYFIKVTAGPSFKPLVNK